jgi:hypothetical protein
LLAVDTPVVRGGVTVETSAGGHVDDLMEPNDDLALPAP